MTQDSLQGIEIQSLTTQLSGCVNVLFPSSVVMKHSTNQPTFRVVDIEIQ